MLVVVEQARWNLPEGCLRFSFGSYPVVASSLLRDELTPASFSGGAASSAWLWHSFLSWSRSRNPEVFLVDGKGVPARSVGFRRGAVKAIGFKWRCVMTVGRVGERRYAPWACDNRDRSSSKRGEAVDGLVLSFPVEQRQDASPFIL